jgi:poly(3-hydroxybutyrate) depolymerase
MPLVLEIHGRGIDAAQLDRLTGFGSLANEAHFVPFSSGGRAAPSTRRG